MLSPTHLPKTPKSAKQKTDVRDAQMLLEQVRGFVLAGNSLPVVWTPPTPNAVKAFGSGNTSTTRERVDPRLMKIHSLARRAWCEPQVLLA